MARRNGSKVQDDVRRLEGRLNEVAANVAHLNMMAAPPINLRSHPEEEAFLGGLLVGLAVAAVVVVLVLDA